MTPPNENDLTKTAQLLSQLQKQLIRYKTALDSIDTASAATHEVAGEIEKLAKTFQGLGEAQADLSQNFEETRRALLHTQQQAQQLRKEMNDLGEHFSQHLSASLQRSLRSIDEKIATFVAPDRDMLQQEVKKLKFFLFLNIFVMFVLFFSAFMYLNRTPSTAQSITERRPTPQTQQPERNTPRAEIPSTPAAATPASSPRIQVLNGCGVEGVAKDFVSFLNGENFAVANAENADNFNYNNSMIYLNGGYPGEAQDIASLLGIPVERIDVSRKKWLDYNITIVIGKDYKSLKARR